MSSGSTAAPAHVQEFAVRVPKNLKKMHHVMRFNATLSVDFAQWKNVKMERENSVHVTRAMEEEMPKFGAGSEYNRDLKEELRRKKFGFQPRKLKQGTQFAVTRVQIFGTQHNLRWRKLILFLCLTNSNRGATVDIEGGWKIGQKIPRHS